MSNADDMTSAIVPKSDQLNADDLIGRELTIRITGVDIKGGQEQPVSIHFDGDNGKPYKPCKSMSRVLVSAWGPDSKKYVGRSMTLYRDAKVKWAGMEVGGIRISHMSNIGEDMTMALTVTRANKKPFTVRPLVSAAVSKAAPPQQSAQASHAPASPASPAVAAPAAGVAPTKASDDMQKTLQAIDAIKGRNGAAACQSMIDLLTNPAEKQFAQEALEFRVGELKAAAKPASKTAAVQAIIDMQGDTL